MHFQGLQNGKFGIVVVVVQLIDSPKAYVNLVPEMVVHIQLFSKYFLLVQLQATAPLYKGFPLAMRTEMR